MILDTHALHRLVLHRVHFLVNQRLRNIDGVFLDEPVHHLFANVGVDLLARLALHVLAHILAELLEATFSDVERGGKLVVERRQDLFRHLAHRDREIGLLAGQFLGRIVLRELDLDRLLLARLHTLQAFFEIGEHLAFAQHDRDLLARSALEFLAVDRPDEVDDDAIPVPGLAIDLVPRRTLTAQAEQHILEIVVADLDIGLFDLDLVEILELDLGKNLEGGHVGEVLVVFALGLDLRSAGRLQVLLHDRVGVALLHDLAEDFLADLLAVFLAHDPRRDLARAEALDPGRLADRLQSGSNLVLDALDRDLDAHAAFQSTGRFDSDIHSVILLKINYLRKVDWCERGDSNSLSCQPGIIPAEKTRLEQLPK